MQQSNIRLSAVLKQQWFVLFLFIFMYSLPSILLAENSHTHHHGMMMDMNTMIMGENIDRLPNDCTQISEEQHFTIKAGRQFAKLDDTFAYDIPIINVQPCARVTVTLQNDDQVRHQWMVHGLPRYLYEGGMFHLEANGGYEVSGTFIVPAHNASYFTHCDIAQHTEKGLSGEVIVGSGGIAIQSNDIKWQNILAIFLMLLSYLITWFLLRK